MSYEIVLTPKVLEDIQKLQKSGNKSALKKFNALIDELQEHPRTGTGQVEQLKYYQEETWSRRLSGEHRIIYRINDEVVEVLVLSAFGHYNDK